MLILPQAAVGCSSQKQNLQPVSSAREQYAAPAAWAMLPPSNSLQLLDETFSISEPE
ncbi:Rz1 family lipoprotein [Pectobacterium colocasium]|uniref:Rz1 family lipoprotein n=1 Tax=Pectobacterium TaxID=122277 RepID=UPI003D71C640